MEPLNLGDPQSMPLTDTGKRTRTSIEAKMIQGNGWTLRQVFCIATGTFIFGMMVGGGVGYGICAAMATGAASSVLSGRNCTNATQPPPEPDEPPCSSLYIPIGGLEANERYRITDVNTGTILARVNRTAVSSRDNVQFITQLELAKLEIETTGNYKLTLGDGGFKERDMLLPQMNTCVQNAYVVKKNPPSKSEPATIRELSNQENPFPIIWI